MYERFYQFKTKPFRLSPDPRFLYQSRVHSKALAYLRYGIQLGEGFIVITGEIGAGKTTLARTMVNSLQGEDFVVAQLVTTQLDSSELVRAVASAFGLNTQGQDKAHVLKTLENFLLARSREGKRVLLLVDEAQNLPSKSLEELRMLSNYQVGERALMQSFLLGQGEFHQVLKGPNMEQFRQRIIASYHLGPLDEEETRHYIEHRLKLVGWANDPVINDTAFKAIFEHSDGIPRRINTLCDRLFLYGCLEEIHEFDGDTVNYVVDEQNKEAPKPSVAEPALDDVNQYEQTTDSKASAVTVSDAERRIIALEKRIQQLEERVTKDRDKIQRLIMMAVLAGDDLQLPDDAIEALRKAD